jgi:hypothetical protein
MAEVAAGSVAIDRDGNAWQQCETGDGWVMAGSEEDYCRSLDDLNAEHGPVQIVWSPTP